MNNIFTRLYVLSILLFSSISTAIAQEPGLIGQDPVGGTPSTPSHQNIKPIKIELDVNAVDLLSGKYRPQMPQMSIAAAPRLSFSTIQQLDTKITWQLSAKNNNASNTGRVESFSITYGAGTSEFIKCEWEICESEDDFGSIIIGFPENGVVNYKQGQTGIVIRYSHQSSYFQGPPSSGTWYADTISFPDGEKLTFHYDTVNNDNINVLHRPNALKSNTGYELNLTYQSEDYTKGASAWSKVKTATIVKSSQPSVALAKHTYTNNSVTDLEGRTWYYTGFDNALGALETAKNFTMRLPGDTHNSITVVSASRDYGGETHNQFVTSVTNNGAKYNYYYTPANDFPKRINFSKLRITGPEGYSRTLNYALAPTAGQNQFTQGGRQWIETDADALGNTMTYAYTGFNRLERVTYPEGNQELLTYDNLGNITSKRSIAKPGSGLDEVIVSASYNILSCNGILCFRPQYIIDGRGNKTDLTFDSNHGNLRTMLEPADANNSRRLTTHTYNKIGSVYRLIKTSVCGTSECGTLHEQVTKYDYRGTTGLAETVTQTNANLSLQQVTNYDFDIRGNVTEVDGPLTGKADATYFEYDLANRRTWEIGVLNEDGLRVSKRNTFRTQDDNIRLSETGTLPNAISRNLTVNVSTKVTFNTRQLPVKNELFKGGEIYSLNQISYNSANRLECQATRMNPATFANLPSSACTLSAEGDNGFDRITKLDYDNVGRVTKTTSGVDTDAEGLDMEVVYSANGKIDTRKDGNFNITTYERDGFDRAHRTTFPNGTYEQFSYDKNDNLKSRRKRNGKVMYHSFDNINLKTNTSIAGEASLFYEYDGLGRQKEVRRSGHATVKTDYDGLGRLEKTETGGKALVYGYNEASQRNKLTHPDGFYVSYDYNNDGSLQRIKARDAEILATYQYNPLGQIDTVTRGNGRVTTIGYDAPGRVAHFDHVGVNRSSFDYNPSNQIISRVVSSSNYQIQIPSVTTRNYSVNNLNQYTDIADKSVYHDTNGNLTSYDGWTYVYNAHNRLTKASKTGQLVDLKYDATGRLYEVTSNGVKTTFLYDGEELVAEYSASGAITNRYVHGIAEDDPLVRYAGASTSINGSNKSYLLTDERGSIVSETNIYGTVSIVHKYGPYGEPINNSSSRFRFTGQILIPGTELYYYKARVYNPELGRFMQTDPIGYEDGMNWYAYVANDPINMADPTGLNSEFSVKIQYRIAFNGNIITQNSTLEGTKIALTSEQLGNAETVFIGIETTQVDGDTVVVHNDEGIVFDSVETPEVSVEANDGSLTEGQMQMTTTINDKGTLTTIETPIINLKENMGEWWGGK